MAITDYLKTIGRARDQFSNVASSPIGDVVSKFASTSIQQMKDNLAAAGKIATGGLQQSLTFDVKAEGNTVIIDFIADDYWDFVNSGVSGTTGSIALQNVFGQTYSFSDQAKTQSSGLNFTESIELWMATRGIVPNDGNTKSLAFVIMQSIKRKGITPTPFVNEVLSDENLSKLDDQVFEAYRKMMTE